MTVCAGETTAENGQPSAPAPAPPGARTRPDALVIAADGGYAARLTLAAGSTDRWFPERWTLDGPEPYAVPLPGRQPEEADTEVQPMADGRVLVRRSVADRHEFALVYPTGPATGEVRLGALERGPATARWSLLPPAPGGSRAYALDADGRASRVWLVAGGGNGPELVAEVPGRCTGGAWLDRTGRLLALDREHGGRTKAVAVDLGRGGAVSPLLQIAQDSTDRLLLADPDSGLLLIRSDAPSPGCERLGWGVLGSTLPVRFPECLRLPGHTVTPFAVQPGQALAPEGCGVALRVDGAGGTWLGVWRPEFREVRRLRPPRGWFPGAGRWTRDGELRLPYATGAVPCGVARLTPAALAAGSAGAVFAAAGPTGDVRGAGRRTTAPDAAGAADAPASPEPSGALGSLEPPVGNDGAGAGRPNGAPGPDSPPRPDSPPDSGGPPNSGGATAAAAAQSTAGEDGPGVTVPTGDGGTRVRCAPGSGVWPGAGAVWGAGAAGAAPGTGAGRRAGGGFGASGNPAGAAPGGSCGEGTATPFPGGVDAARPVPLQQAPLTGRVPFGS
ncbi:hypothetical protein ACFWIA_16285 [Streptomyces sp. NPDC127068]|uniref:hypothetical protein n=1 Tax=Streptomyces sp. NPDC127068 TaxID=3347127 RepID=UPI00365D523A